MPCEDRDMLGKHHVTMESETEVLQLQGKECLVFLEARKDGASRHFGGNRPYNTLISSFWP